MARGSGGGVRGADYGKDKAWFEERAKFRITKPGAVVLPISRKGSIRLDPKIKDTVKELIDELAPMVGAAFDKHFMPYAQHIYETWPFKSGHSRDLLSLEYDIRGGGEELVAYLESGAEYTRYIHRGAQVRKMYDAGKEAANRVADELMGGLI